jgi:hypothetical protein
VLKEERAAILLAAEADDNDPSRANDEINNVENCDCVVEKTVDCVNSKFDPVPLKELREIYASDENVESCMPAGDDKYVKMLDWSWPLLEETIACVSELVVDVNAFVIAIVVEPSDDTKNE